MTQPLPGGRPGRAASTTVPRVAVAGIHGYGAAHVMNALHLQSRGRVELVGLVDPVRGPIVRAGVTLPVDELPPHYPTLGQLLDDVEVDIVVVATPLHTHAEIAETALSAGADVLLEKPPVTDLDSLAVLAEAQRRTGGLVQVGFQSLGSHALNDLMLRIADGELGVVTAIGAAGSWTRDRAYWARSAWAGRRELDGIRVADGVVSNPFAHAVMTALRIAGWDSVESVGEMEVDLMRVNRIEADDTSAVRIHPSALGARRFAGTITCAFTLAGPREDDPYIVVQGTEGTARLFYTEDRLVIGDDDRRYGRDDLLENMIDVRDGVTELISPLKSTGGFVRVIDRISHENVRDIDPAFVTWNGSDHSARPVLAGVDSAVADAAATQRLFRELGGVEWAR